MVFSDKSNIVLFFIVVLVSHVACFLVPRGVMPVVRSFVRKTSKHAVDLNAQIFCNVELNADYIEAVGFDMDFTLAQYNEEYERAVFDAAKVNVCKAGYPSEVLSLQSTSDKFLRGLVIDKERGNILKIDRHKYVRSATHGSKVLPPELRKVMYNKEVVSFSEENFVNIDSMYLLVDAQLFSHLVDLKDRSPLMNRFSYEQIYRDVRTAVEDALREGSLAKAVMEDPGKYITYDEGVVHTLRQLRAAGKKTFLLTNSFWNYTNAIMDYVVHGGNDKYKEIDWKDLFHIIIVGANKPAFLTNDALSLFKVDENGMLYNMDDRDALQCTPASPASAATTSISSSQRTSTTPTNAARSSGAPAASCWPRVYQGGFWQDLHRLLAVSYGDKILYVGDQMFSDILRSKRTLGWRTCLVVPELERETATADRERALYAEVLKLRHKQHALDEHTDQLAAAVEAGDCSAAEQLACAHIQAEEVKRELREALARYDDKFNALWGQLFKAGLHDSRFAKQVRNYACLYTSKVSNLRYVSPSRSFRPVNDFMSQDQVLGSDALTQGYPVSDAAGD